MLRKLLIVLLVCFTTTTLITETRAQDSDKKIHTSKKHKSKKKSKKHKEKKVSAPLEEKEMTTTMPATPPPVQSKSSKSSIPEQKMKICHIPNKNLSQAIVITIPASTLAEHTAHGDPRPLSLDNPGVCPPKKQQKFK